MNRLATFLRKPGRPCLVLALCAATASPALAAEGGLQLLPDFKTTLPGLLVGFLLLIWPLNALLFRPLIKTLDERDERIAGTRAKAARLNEEAQSVLARYQGAIREAREASENERRGKIDEARARMLETTATARSAAEAELERARAELASTLEQARDALRSQAHDLAREAASSVLGRAV